MRTHRPARPFLPWLTTALLAGCGGNGTLALELTDAPPDTENMKEVVVTLSRIEVHTAGKDGDDGEDDKSWSEVPLTEHEFDLLKLQNDVTTTLGELELPDGKITQIRLFIDEDGRNEVVLNDDRKCALDLKSVEKGGIKINHPFKALDVEEGKKTNAVVDFDLKESVTKDGDCSYRLNPVIKLKRAHKDGQPLDL